ncbi:ribosome biogenesis protein NOP53 [Euphorbia lathyris]|uniref:ribosome biogenesis protein NOP53 n=1 Tax=Euphorbia lathyris TaxID=212925 RepID=UPI003313EDD1
MGKKSKSSRKGKKAWRANISTEDIDDFIEKSTKDALSGGSLSNVPTESLFFVDKSKDLSVRRKIEKRREKVLRCDSILQKNPFVQTVPSSNQKEKKKSKKNQRVSEPNDPKGSATVGGSEMVDLWENNGEPDNKIRKVSIPSAIPAVEVEAPGCSYNPPPEAHQDSLAQAVAEEMQKIYQSELGPQPVPLVSRAELRVLDEEDMCFLEADNGDEDEDNITENEDTTLEKKSGKLKRVTRVELNKRARQKEQKKKLAESKKKEGLSKEIDSLDAIINEIAKEDEEKHKKHVRRVVAKQERLKVRPPRLGKHKFEPAPPQVLLSEEITGSLRQLKGCCTLLKDRFKSLEKRGLIPPAKSRRK